jgi:Holliday junction resolvase
MPNSVSSQLGVTDLLAVFEIDGERKSFLVEVKTSKEGKLDWSEKYVNKLKSYSELTQMPVLIAWKCTEFEFSEWLLISLDDFKKPNKNYKINYADALKRNLLSKYARDYYVTLPENFAINLAFRKEQNVEKSDNSETWDVYLESLKLIGRNEHNIEKLSIGLFALFVCLGIEEVTEVTNEHIINKLKPYNTIIPIHKIPLLLTRIFNEKPISWIEQIQNEKYPLSYSDLFNDLKNGIADGLVNQILFTVPYKN